MKILVVVVALLILSACAPLREVRFDVLENSVAGAFPEIESTNTIDIEADFITQRIQKLESLVEEMPGVENVKIAILENAALVYLEFEEHLVKKDIKAKKKVIEHKIKQVDSSLRYVSVSATEEMINKIYEVLEKN